MNDQPVPSPAEEELPEQAPQKQKKQSAVASVFELVEMFAWSVFAVLIIFSFAFRLCRVDGRSMENTLYDQENLLIYSLAYTPEVGDIVVFHLTETDANMEKTLVKRVIAVGGQKIKIDFNTSKLYIDGVECEDDHAVFKNRDTGEPMQGYSASLPNHSYNSTTHIFEATVPDGHIFVLGDNRNNSTDSRSTSVNFVDERCVLGKVVIRLYPFAKFS